MPAKYERVINDIREQIRSGRLRPGQQIPSTTQLKAIYGVSYGTIRNAMLILKADGWIEGRQGDGVFVVENPPIG